MKDQNFENCQITFPMFEDQLYYPPYIPYVPYTPIKVVPTDGRKPYRYPICGGSGIVDSGFYNRTPTNWTSCGGTETCRACAGIGVIWG